MKNTNFFVFYRQKSLSYVFCVWIISYLGLIEICWLPFLLIPVAQGFFHYHIKCDDVVINCFDRNWIRFTQNTETDICISSSELVLDQWDGVKYVYTSMKTNIDGKKTQW